MSMYRGTYTLTNGSGGTTVSTAITVLQLKAGANCPLALLRAQLSQRGSTTSAQERFSIVRKSAAATVTTAVAGTHLFKHSTSAPTSDVSLGTAATGITATVEGTDSDVLCERGFNVLNGVELVWVPEERIIVPVNGIIALKFLTAPASQTWFASLTFAELC
jgi:hypothetical protein